MNKINTSDMVALALLLIGVVIIYLSWNVVNMMLIQYIGIAGGTLLILAEGVFLFQKYKR